MNLFLVSVFVFFVIFPYCGSFFWREREQAKPWIDKYPDERELIPTESTVEFVSTRDTSAEFFHPDQLDESGLFGTVFRSA
jgi:hypothetical protein